MKVNTSHINQSFCDLINEPSLNLTLDADIVIPPCRYFKNKTFDFEIYKEIFLAPLFNSFSNVAIHEDVYSEIVKVKMKQYVDGLRGSSPPSLNIYEDASLSQNEQALRNTIENKIYPYTKYDPTINNKTDRGEVKTLSYIAAKGYPFFVTYDYNAIQLVENAAELGTGLDNLSIIHNYELIYYFFKEEISDKKSLRILYKYLYYYFDKEKKINPSWSDFIIYMDRQYGEVFNSVC